MVRIQKQNPYYKERDREIYDRWKKKESIKSIADDYEITTGRVENIITRQKKERSEE